MDLRAEFKSFIEEELGGIGRWVLLRKFSKVKSKYWNDITKESVGGPEYDYDDILVEAYSAPGVSGIARKREGVTALDMGDMDITSEAFFFEYTVDVKMNDEIYELDWEHKEKPTVVYKTVDEDISNGLVVPKRRYKVKKTEEPRGDFGRIEYKVAYCERSMLR